MRKFNFKRVMALVLSVVLLLGVMPISSVMAAPAAQAAQKKVLIWYSVGHYDNTVKTAYQSMSLTVDEMEETSSTFPTDLSDYGLVWIWLPQTDMTSAATETLKNYVESGGVVVLQGERPSFTVQNNILSALATSLGGSFTISGTDPEVSGSCVFNSAANSTLLENIGSGDSVNCDAAANIQLGNNATWVAQTTQNGSTANFIVEQKVGNGYLIGISDINWYRGKTDATANQLIKNMYTHSVENIEMVSSKVLLWTTGLNDANDSNNLSGWGLNSYNSAVDMFGCAMPGITVEKANGSEMPSDLSGYSLVWIHLPAITEANYAEKVNVDALKAYINKGGRVVLLTETNTMMSSYNAGITALAKALGGGFTVGTENTTYGTNALNSDSSLTADANVSDFDSSNYIFPTLSMSGNVQWVAKQGDSVYIADQATGNGRLTVVVDFNWYTKNLAAAFTDKPGIVQIFENLVTDTKANMATVAEGGSPNESFGVIEVGSEAELNAAIANAIPGISTTIKLKNGINLVNDIEIPAGKNIVLDLNGSVVKAAANKHAVSVAEGAKLTVKDSSQYANGKLVGESSSWHTVQNRGDVVVESGTVSGNGCAINLPSGSAGTVVVNGGTVLATNTATGYGIINDSEKDGVAVTINGGTVTGPKAGLYHWDNDVESVINGGVVKATGNDGMGVDNTAGGKITVTGGEISATGNKGVGIVNFGIANISGGTVSGTKMGVQNGDTNNGNHETNAANVKLTVTGGTIKDSGNSNGGYGIGNYYGSEATVSGDDTAISGHLDGIANTGTLTVNGGTIKGTASNAGQGISNGNLGYGTLVMNGGTVYGERTGILNNTTATVNGGSVSGKYMYGLSNNGTMTVGGDGQKADISVSGAYGASNSGTLNIGEKSPYTTTIAGTTSGGAGIVNGHDGSGNATSMHIYNSTTGTIKMTGGTVKGNRGGASGAYAIINGSRAQDNVISGGTLIADTSTNIQNHTDGVWELGTSLVLKNTRDDNWFNNPIDSSEISGVNKCYIKDWNHLNLVVTNGADDDGFYTATFSAKLDSAQSVQSAIADAKDGEVIKLEGDIEGHIEIPAGKNVVLDLNGHKIENTNGRPITNYGTLKVIDSSEEQTGALTGSTHGIWNFGTLTVEAGTITGTGNEAIINDKTATSVTVTGGTLRGGYAAICDYDADGTVVLSNCVLEGLGGEWVISSYGADKGGSYTINPGVVLKNEKNPTQLINTDSGAAANNTQVAVANWDEIVIEDGVVKVNTAPMLSELESEYNSVKDYINGLQNITGAHKTALLAKLEAKYAEAQAAVKVAATYADAVEAKNAGEQALNGQTYSTSVYGNGVLINNIDKIAADKAAAIQAMTGIGQEEKDALIKDIMDAADAFANAVIGATETGAVNVAYGTFNNAINLAMAKAKAMDEVVLAAKAEQKKVNESQNLKDGEKAAWNAEFDNAVKKAIAAISATTAVDAVEVQKNAALGTIETYSTLVANANITNLVNGKADAAEKVAEALEAAKKTINGLKNLSNEEKSDLIAAAEAAATKATTEIMACSDLLEVADALADGIAAIAKVEEKAVTDDATALTNAKDAAVKEIGDALDEAIKAIDALKNLSDEEKAAAKKAAEDAAKAAIEAVNSKDSIADVNSAKETGIAAIADAKDKAAQDDAAILAAAKEAAIKNIDEKLDAVNKAIDALKNLSAEEKEAAKKAAAEAAKNAKDAVNGKDSIADVAAAEKAGISAIADVETDAVSDNKVNKFIADYLTDADGNIIKDATDENYKNILAGLDDWNALSDAEKEAVKAILAANGSKAFDEMVKSAEAIKTEKETVNSPQTGDNSHIYLWMSIMLISLAALVLLYKKKALLSK